MRRLTHNATNGADMVEMISATVLIALSQSLVVILLSGAIAKKKPR